MLINFNTFEINCGDYLTRINSLKFCSRWLTTTIQNNAENRIKNHFLIHSYQDNYLKKLTICDDNWAETIQYFFQFTFYTILYQFYTSEIMREDN